MYDEILALLIIATLVASFKDLLDAQGDPDDADARRNVPSDAGAADHTGAAS